MAAYPSENTHPLLLHTHKTYVGNRISFIIDQISPDRWRHVPGIQNPADCASRGLFPLQLKDHNLWWQGPDWLRSNSDLWAKQTIGQNKQF